MAFEHLNSKPVFQGRAFDVRQEDVRLPDGQVKTFDLVTHVGAVTLVPVDDAGRIWFVRQYRVGARAHVLELPAGTLEAGEDPEVCARREVREEIGMAAGTLRKVGEFYMAPGYSTEYMYVYLATGLHSSPLPGDDDEFLEAISIPADEVYEMVTAGEIHDGKSLAALLLAQPFIEARR